MRKIFAFSLVSLMVFSACSGKVRPIYAAHQINEPNKIFNSATNVLNPDYVRSVTTFANNFYQLINDDNKVFSPLSIAACFSMLYEGAQESSKEELATLLGYEEHFNHQTEIKNMLLNNAIKTTKPEVILDIAQSFWVDELFKNELNQDFVDILTDYYFAEAFQGLLNSDKMHEALAQYINSKTNHFFDLNSEDFKDFAGVLWLLNTIYLKAPWVDQFPVRSNYEGSFTNLDKSTNNVTFMTNAKEGYYYVGDEYLISSYALEGGFKFNILLPNSNSNFQAVLANPYNVFNLLDFPKNSISKTKAYITYKVPKFNTTSVYDLKEQFADLGVEKVFNPNEANLKDICINKDVKNLYVERATHQAGIDVNNEGVEAAAYTIIQLTPTSSPHLDERLDFFVDRPFAYTISDNSGLPLFMGLITNLG